LVKLGDLQAFPDGCRRPHVDGRGTLKLLPRENGFAFSAANLQLVKQALNDLNFEAAGKRQLHF
jgi:hypothetical protein